MEERERILKMLEEGKITADEAAKLLNALGETYRWGPRHVPGPDFGKRIARKVELSLKDLPDTIAASISGLGYVVGSGEKKQLEFGAKENLIIKTVSGDINVNGDDEASIRVDLCCGHKIKEGEHELIIKTMAGDMDVKVPSSQKLVLKAASGDVRLENLADVSVRSGSGDFEIKNVSVRLAAALGSGDLDICKISGPMAVSLGSGDLHAGGITGEVTVSVGSGDIDLDIEECKGGKVELGSGDATLSLPAKMDVELIVFKPKDGEISSDFDLKPSKEDEEELHATIGKPKGKLFVKVKHGDITIRKRSEK